MHKVSARPGLGYAAGIAALALCAVVAVQLAAGAYSADLGTTGDQAAHYVTALMLRDYLVDALGANPMRFAIEYYEHFPRVALGHWPPLFHATAAMVVLALGRAVAVQIGFQAVILAALCTATAMLVAHRHGRLAGAAAGLVVLAIPVVMFLSNAVMLDNFLALLTLVAVLAWARFAATMDWRWSLAFGVLVSCAVLTKGNGYGLALVPLFHALLARRLSWLWNWRTWLSAVPVLVLTLPWLALTYRISSDGWNYPWGWGYTGPALTGFSVLAVEQIGPILLVLFALGMAATIGRAGRGHGADVLAPAMAAAVLAIACFSVLVPADIQARYLVPAIAPLVLLAAEGAALLATAAGRLGLAPSFRPWGAAGVLLVAGLLVVRLPHVDSLRMDEAARTILGTEAANPIVLAIGWPNAEGALIAAFAERDVRRTHYVVRGTKALAAGNFMGTDYRARFTDPADLAAWFAATRIGWVVVQLAPESLAFSHVAMVAELARAQGWQEAARLQGARGTVVVYALDRRAVTPGELRDLLQQIQPTKLIGQF